MKVLIFSIRLKSLHLFLFVNKKTKKFGSVDVVKYWNPLTYANKNVEN